MTNAKRWIEALRLSRHPEGGWFREVYRSNETIPHRSLPTRFAGDRPFSTAIYFLLEETEVSVLHRIQQDEVWHFYDGGRLTIHNFDTEGSYSKGTLGRCVDDGDRLMFIVQAGTLFGATVETSDYVLAGCTVAPGFDFKDFEMPKRRDLLKQYPRHREIIKRLTR
jgi:predicted cupin superfamily sugar epimerase